MWHSFVNNTMHLTMVVMILENNIGFGKAKFEFLGFFLMLPISFFWVILTGYWYYGLVLWLYFLFQHYLHKIPDIVLAHWQILPNVA